MTCSFWNHSVFTLHIKNYILQGNLLNMMAFRKYTYIHSRVPMHTHTFDICLCIQILNLYIGRQLWKGRKILYNIYICKAKNIKIYKNVMKCLSLDIIQKAGSICDIRVRVKCNRCFVFCGHHPKRPVLEFRHMTVSKELFQMSQLSISRIPHFPLPLIQSLHLSKIFQ